MTHYIKSLWEQFLKAEKAVSSKGDTYYKVNPKRMYVLKAILGRFISTAEKATDTRIDPHNRILNILTGTKIYTPDIEKEKERKVTEMLKELGILKTFSKDYIPQNKKKGRKY